MARRLKAEALKAVCDPAGSVNAAVEDALLANVKRLKEVRMGATDHAQGVH